MTVGDGDCLLVAPWIHETPIPSPRWTTVADLTPEELMAAFVSVAEVELSNEETGDADEQGD